MKPQNSLFNWATKKDLPGCKKPILPRIVITPPPNTSRILVQKRKKSPNNKTHRAPLPKLDLGPNFWSPETEMPRVQKQRILFKCRKNECQEQFHSASDRKIHESFCLPFDEVYIF